MKRLLTALLIASTMIIANTAFAFKVGIIDLQAVSQKTQLVSKMRQAIEQQQKQFFQSIASVRAQLQAAQAKVNDKTASAADKTSAQATMKTARAALQQKQMQFSKQLAATRKGLSDKLWTKLTAAVGTVAKAKGLNMVLHKNGVAYLDDSTDVTQDVIAELNKANGAQPQTTQPSN